MRECDHIRVALAAVATVSMALPSAAAAECRPRIDPGLEGFTSDLPLVALVTCGAPLAPRPAVPAAFAIYLRGPDGKARFTGAPAASGELQARYIGHSSLALPKRHVAVTLAQPAALLGMPAAARWVLHGPMADKTLVRNAVVYGWARSLGLPSPRMEPVELFAGEGGDTVTAADGRGVYYLMEWVEPGAGRLPIAPGGFLFRRDKGGGDEPVVDTSHGERFLIDFPRPATDEQRVALQARLDQVESRLFGDASLAELEPLLDLGSFVDDALLVEVTKNADGFKWSTFFHYPDAAGPLRAGPPFDYDAALRNDRVAVDPTGWQHRYPRPERSAWMPELWRRPEFVQRLADRYAELRRGPFETGRALGAIDARVRALGDAAERNDRRWEALGARVLTNPDAAGSAALEVERMKNWLELRLEWLDQQFVPAPRPGSGREILVAEGEVPTAERLSPASEVSLVSFPAGEVACGTPARRRIARLPAADELRIVTRGPPASEFQISISGVAEVRKLTLPIQAPRRELGSAVDGRGQLLLTFRRALPSPAPGPMEVVVTTTGSTQRCRAPAVEVRAVRFARWRVPGTGPFVARARRGVLWSPPLAIP